MSDFNSREAVLSLPKAPRVKPVEIPGVGTFHVRTITSSERDEFEAENIDSKGRPQMKNLRARFVTLVLSDEEGNRILQPQDALVLAGWPAEVTNTLWAEGSTFNGMGPRAVEDAEKN